MVMVVAVLVTKGTSFTFRPRSHQTQAPHACTDAARASGRHVEQESSLAFPSLSLLHAARERRAYNQQQTRRAHECLRQKTTSQPHGLSQSERPRGAVIAAHTKHDIVKSTRKALLATCAPLVVEQPLWWHDSGFTLASSSQRLLGKRVVWYASKQHSPGGWSSKGMGEKHILPAYHATCAGCMAF